MSGKSAWETSPKMQALKKRLDSGVDLDTITENDFTTFLVLYAEHKGWFPTHIPDSRRALGRPGAPDLLLMRGDEVLTVELKTETGRLSKFQKMWQASNPERYWIWRPRDWRDIRIHLA